MSRSDEPELTEPNRPEEEPAPGAPDAAGRRKIVLISVAAVVVLVVAGVVVYLLTNGDDPADTADQGRDVPTITNSPAPSTQTPTRTSSAVTVAPPATATGEVAAAESIAEQAATAISSADIAALSALSCDPSSVGTEETFPEDATAEVVGEPQITGDTATVDLKLTIAGSEPTTVPMPLTKKDGRWCVP